jgi:hypothetical protein
VKVKLSTIVVGIQHIVVLNASWFIGVVSTKDIVVEKDDLKIILIVFQQKKINFLMLNFDYVCTMYTHNVFVPYLFISIII